MPVVQAHTKVVRQKDDIQKDLRSLSDEEVPSDTICFLPRQEDGCCCAAFISLKR